MSILAQMHASHTSTGPLVCPAHIPEACQSDLGQPARFTCDLESLAVSCGRNTKIPLAVAVALAASSRAFTPAIPPVYLASLPGSTVPSRQAGIAPIPPPGTGQVLKYTSPAEATADKIQVRSASTRCLSSRQPADKACVAGGAVASSHPKDILCDSEMTTACPGSNDSTTACPTLSKTTSQNIHGLVLSNLSFS